MTTPQERPELIERVLAAYESRTEDVAQAISREMGAPIGGARASQVENGAAHLRLIDTIRHYSFERLKGHAAKLAVERTRQTHCAILQYSMRGEASIAASLLYPSS